tara:strand:- start:1234 stop:2556 length:1323 start_codon:yes stop_codon:yes gene_type:complete
MIATSRFQLPRFILCALLSSAIPFLGGCDSTTGAASGKENEAHSALEKLVTQLEKLPGIGGSGARKAAQHILDSSQAEAIEMADAIRAVKAAPRSSSTEKRPVPISVRTASQGDISSYYKTNATLEVDKEADIVARVSGLVKTISVEEGDEVEAGGVLLEIENDEYQHRVSLSSARVKNLKSKMDRLKALTDDLVSAQERETAESEYDTALADLELARLNLSYTTVRAPFAGRIVLRMVDPGQNVGNDTPVFHLSDFRSLLAKVYVPAKEFKNLKMEQDVNLVLDSSKDVMKGRIKLISPVIDPATGTIKITVEVSDYPANTRPGDFAEVQVITDTHSDVVLVPRFSVITDHHEQVVFIAAEDNTAERRPVETGYTDDDNAEITSGIKVGERVIVKGQRRLENGTILKILDSENEVPEVSQGSPGSQKKKRPGPKGYKRK